jgi:transcriptional regulator with XRE-family HTH domain
MSDLAVYTKRRAQHDPDFAEGLETGYAAFKIGVLLRQARERAGLTQEEVAQRLDTKKSAISRIENRAGDIRLSTLERYATAIGWDLSLQLRPGEGRRATGSPQRARSAPR